MILLIIEISQLHTINIIETISTFFLLRYKTISININKKNYHYSNPVPFFASFFPTFYFLALFPFEGSPASFFWNWICVRHMIFDVQSFLLLVLVLSFLPLLPKRIFPLFICSSPPAYMAMFPLKLLSMLSICMFLIIA